MFFFSLILATWISNSIFLVCTWIHAFTYVVLNFMNVRKNCKVFSFCLKQATINYFTCVRTRMCVFIRACTYVCTCTFTLMHMWPCVCTNAWHACVYMYATFADQLIPRPPVFHFIYVNTSIDYECFCTFFNVSVLKSNVHS